MAPVRTGAHAALFYLVSLWPLTVVLMLAIGLLWSAAYFKGP